MIETLKEDDETKNLNFRNIIITWFTIKHQVLDTKTSEFPTVSVKQFREILIRESFIEQ